MSTPAEFAVKMRLAETAARGTPRVATEAAAQLTKKLVQANSPDRLRGVGKNGRKLGVRYTIVHGDDTSQALVFVTGPFQLIERNTSAHQIPRVRGPRARVRYAVIPGVGPRRSAQHPGTHGKHPFERSVAAAPRLMLEAHAGALFGQYRAIF